MLVLVGNIVFRIANKLMKNTIQNPKNKLYFFCFNCDKRNAKQRPKEKEKYELNLLLISYDSYK